MSVPYLVSSETLDDLVGDRGFMRLYKAGHFAVDGKRHHEARSLLGNYFRRRARQQRRAKRSTP